MIRNYLTIGWRTIRRDKVYSSINIGGLAVGMAVAILIGLWVHDELSFNKYFANYDRIGHVMVHNGEGTYPSNPVPLVDELRNSFSSEFKHVGLATWPEEHPINFGDKKFFQKGIFMQPETAGMLSLEFVTGSARALTESNTIMISESLAKKLFDESDAIDKIVRVRDEVDVRVGAVYKDLPHNTDFNGMTFVGSWEFLKTWKPWVKESETNWRNNSFKIFVELNPGVSYEDISAKIKDVKLAHLDEERRAYKPELFVHPMSKWHLYSRFVSRASVTSEELQYVWLFGIIGAFVLTLGCINFMNLSTARSEKRAKEVGVRKTMGSLRSQLVGQFFSESFITVGISVVAALLLAYVSLPWFNNIASKHIALPFNSPLFWTSILLFVVFTGFLAGSYPAFYLSSFKPIRVLKGTYHAGRLASLPRKILVVVQFTVSITLITGTVIVYKQIEFAKSRPVGYNREGLISVPMITGEIKQHFQVIKNELLQSGVVTNVTSSMAPVTDVYSSSSGFEWKNKSETLDESFMVQYVSVDYGKTVGWNIMAGRDFSNELASDTASFIINEAAAKYMGFTQPVGEIVSWDNKKFQIVGMAEDIVMQSPYQEVLPAIYTFSPSDRYTITIRLNSSIATSESLERVTAIFQKYSPAVPFQYAFADQQYEKKFRNEVRLSELAFVFSALAIFISCLGLFGLASFVAEQRRKEIGIRKIVGASLTDLWMMLSRSFVIPVIISCVIGFPIAYKFLSEWLTKYQYRITIPLWIFPAIIAAAVAIALVTISYQTIRASLRNPVDSLKSE